MVGSGSFRAAGSRRQGAVCRAVRRRRRLPTVIGVFLLPLCASGVSRGEQETLMEWSLMEWSLMDAIGGRALQEVADLPELSYSQFVLVKPGQFIPGEVGQKLYLFGFRKGWFQIREDIPFDLWPGGGLRHFHVTELLPPDRVFARLGLKDMKKYRDTTNMFDGKVEDPECLRKLGVERVRKGDGVDVNHRPGWEWWIWVHRPGRRAFEVEEDHIRVDTEAWYLPSADLGAALAAAGIAVVPGDIGKSSGVQLLGRIREAGPLVEAGLVGLENGAAVIVETAGNDEWNVRSAAIGFPLSVRIGADRLEKSGIEGMLLLGIPRGLKVDGRVVSRKLARRVGLAHANTKQRVSLGFEESARTLLVATDEEEVELSVDVLLAAGGK